MDFSRYRYLVGGDSILRLCWLVVHQPEVGVDGAWSGSNPVAETRVHGVGFVWIVVAAVVDEDLESLGGVLEVEVAIWTRTHT
jgi:hypothetical protein